MQCIKYKLLYYAKYLGTLGYLKVGRVKIVEAEEGGGGWQIFWNLIDDFTVSGEMPLLKFPCGVQLGLWTRKTLWKSVKIQRMSTLVCGFFCIIMPCANIYFSHSQTFRQLVKTKIRTWRWRWEKIFDFQIMVEALQFSDSSGFNITGWITAFYRGLTRFAPPSKMSTLTLKSFVVGGLIKGGDLILEINK